MKGFHIIPGSQSYNATITMWKVQASNDGIVFDHVVPPITTPFKNGTLYEVTFQASANYAYWRFHMISMDNAERAGISLLQWIPTSPDRFHPRKCPVGYIPRLMSHVNYCGFEASGNGVLQTAFKGDGSEYQWHPARSTAPYFITITCPTAVRIWKVGLRGRDRLSHWSIEATNNSFGLGYFIRLAESY